MNPSPKQALQIVLTDDGSQTILNEQLGSTYHSRHGALTESEHVFVDKGLRKLLEKGVTKVTLLEMGLGTGLNVLLTALLAAEAKVSITYHGLELFPVGEELWNAYRLPTALDGQRDLYERIHRSDWNRQVILNDHFKLVKHEVSLLDFQPSEKFDLIYFDAFEPETQPELWTMEVFEKLFSWMNGGAVLTTYCCKGYVRRNMMAAGFEVEKVPGPPGKREMIVANKRSA